MTDTEQEGMEMKFTFLAIVSGGYGPDVWDNEVTVSGEDMTIKQALEEVEKGLEGVDAVVVQIEQVD